MTFALAVLVASLLGSVHCAAMCGAFTCLYAPAGSTWRESRNAHAAYNVGRLAAELGPIGNEPMVSLAGLLASGQVVAPARSDRPPPTLPLAVWAGIRMDSVLREVRGR